MDYCDLELLSWEDDGGKILLFDSSMSNESIIRQRMAEYSAARNSHDAKAMAMFFTEDADLIGTTGQVSKGRVAIEQTFSHEHATVYFQSKAIRRIREIRFLSADVAVVNGEFEVSNVLSAKGEPLPVIKGLFTFLWKCIGGRWLIAAYRSMLPVSVFQVGQPLIANQNLTFQESNLSLQS